MMIQNKLIKASILFLKIITIIAFIPVVYLCGVLFPMIIHSLIIGDLEMDIPVFTLMISAYIIAIFYCFGLSQFFLILNLIKSENSFEQLLRKFKKLTICAGVITIILFLDLVPLYLFANREDAPGILLLGIILVGVSLVVTIILLLIKELGYKYKNNMSNY